jgi:hypothetical protein
MITFLTWLWGHKYPASHVAKLRAGITRNHAGPHQFFCVSNRDDLQIPTIPIQDPDLLQVADGCYARLRMFDPAWQAKHGITQLVNLDLDLVVTGKLDKLFAPGAGFKILHGGHFNPCPFNGSVMMIEAGARPEIWQHFNVDAAVKVAHADGFWRGSDQTWIAYTAPDAAGWTFRDGIYGFRKPGWPSHGQLPDDARIVAFPGSKDPSKFTGVEWIRRHWG